MCEYCEFNYENRKMGWIFHTRVDFVFGNKKHESEFEYSQLAHAIEYQADNETDYYELRIVIHGMGKYKDGYKSTEINNCPWCGRDLKG